jgi:hypothetical protein
MRLPGLILARILASRFCFGREPKVKVTTTSGKISFILSLCNFTIICMTKSKMLCNLIIVNIIERNILRYHVQQMKLMSI